MTAITSQGRRNAGWPRFGDWVVAVAVVLAFVETVLNYFFSFGIAYSAGALLVVISTLLILVALVTFRIWDSMPRWFAVVLGVLTLLDFVGTAIAGYFLEADLLVLLMLIALVAWLFTAFVRPRPMERIE